MSLSTILRDIARTGSPSPWVIQGSTGGSIAGPTAIPIVSWQGGFSDFQVKADSEATTRHLRGALIGAGVGLPGFNWGGSVSTPGQLSLPSWGGRIYMLPAARGSLAFGDLRGRCMIIDPGSGGAGMGVDAALMLFGSSLIIDRALEVVRSINMPLGLPGMLLNVFLEQFQVALFHAVAAVAQMGITIGSPGVSVMRGELH